ncbi:Uncharacterised protein [Bordetella pertussis]|nr:Uncharacterised protein [Bordetella pertussis]
MATPRAKLMPNSVPQNIVIRFQIWRPVMTYTLSMMARMNDRPSVRGTNRKWYSAVAANWNRDRLTTSRSIMETLPDGRPARTADMASRLARRP